LTGRVWSRPALRYWAADFRENNLNFKAEELAEREKRLAKRQSQELAIARKRLEELQIARVSEAWKV
jgi:hypothetical protein